MVGRTDRVEAEEGSSQSCRSQVVNMVCAEPMLSDVPASFVHFNRVAGAKLKNASDAVPQSSTAVDWATHLTAEAKLRSQPTLRRLVVGSAGKHEVAGLHGGLPHPSIFPLEGITLHLKGGASLTIDDPQTVGYILYSCLLSKIIRPSIFRMDMQANYGGLIPELPVP